MIKLNMEGENTERIIYFIHLHKCGGSFLNSIFRKLNDKYVILGHYTLSLQDKGDDKVIGIIRNPFEWYVSLWSSGCALGNGLYFKTEYPDKLYLYNDSKNIDNFREWLKFILTEYDGSFDPLEDREKYNIGILTQRFFSLYNDNNYTLLEKIDENPIVDHFIRNESIIENVNNYLNLNLDINDYEKKNVSKHLSYDKYYDNDTIKLITEKDRYIFDKFDYSWII